VTEIRCCKGLDFQRRLRCPLTVESLRLLVMGWPVCTRRTVPLMLRSVLLLLLVLLMLLGLMLLQTVAFRPSLVLHLWPILLLLLPLLLMLPLLPWLQLSR